jgi:hypothetical protein
MALPSDDNYRIPIARHRIGRIDTYEVPVSDFDRIEEVAGTVGSDLTFATLGLSVAVTLTVTLNTVTIVNERLHNEFFIVTVMFYLLAVVCGYRWWRQVGDLKKLMDRIRKMQVGPLGDEGQEYSSAALANMPLEAAPTPVAPVEPQRRSITEEVVVEAEISAKPKQADE